MCSSLGGGSGFPGGGGQPVNAIGSRGRSRRLRASPRTKGRPFRQVVASAWEDLNPKKIAGQKQVLPKKKPKQILGPKS